MTEHDLLQILRNQVALAGSQRLWAKAHGVPESVISTTLSGRRALSPLVANALGFAVRTTYARVIGGSNNNPNEGQS